MKAEDLARLGRAERMLVQRMSGVSLKGFLHPIVCFLLNMPISTLLSGSSPPMSLFEDETAVKLIIIIIIIIGEGREDGWYEGCVECH